MDRLWRRGRGGVLDIGWPPGSTPPGGKPGAAQGIQSYGRGRYDEQSGLYEWYETPEHVRRQEAGTAVTWEQILTRWDLVEADLHETYGIDLDQPRLLPRHTWRWLQSRIIGLLSADTRLSRALAPEPER